MPAHQSIVPFVNTKEIELTERKHLLETKHYRLLGASGEPEALTLFSTHFVDAVVIGEHVEGKTSV